MPATESLTGSPAPHAGLPVPQSLSPQPQMGVAGNSGQIVELVTPPVLREEDLDADHDEDAPLWFRNMDNILGPVSPCGLAPRALPHELHVMSSDETTSFAEAKWDPCCRRAMFEEMKAIEDNEMWYLEDLPLGRHTIGLKWIFKV
jgi:hypothetical protein